MSPYTCKFKNLITNALTNVVYPPLGLDNIKVKWMFSTDFPIGCNAAISTDTLRFIKDDAQYLYNEWIVNGECSAIGFIVQINGTTLEFKIDFSAAGWDGDFFEVGLKYSSLLDRVKIADNEKVSVSGALVAENLDTDLNDKNTASSVSQINIWANYHAVRINSDNDFNESEKVQDISGLPYKMGQNMGITTDMGQHLSHYYDGANTLIDWYFYNEKKCLISFPLTNGTDANIPMTIDFNSIWNGFLPLADASFFANSKIKVEIWQIFKVSLTDSNDDTNKVDYLTTTQIGTSTLQTINSDNISFADTFIANPYTTRPYSMYNYGTFVTDAVQCFIVLRPFVELSIINAISPTITATGSVEMNATFSFSWHYSADNILAMSVPTYINRLNSVSSSQILDSSQIYADYELMWRNAKITTPLLMTGQGTDFQLKCTDVMKALSMLYACVFVESNNHYEVLPIDDYFTAIKASPVTINHWYNKKITAGLNYDTISIGDEEVPRKLFYYDIFRKNRYRIPNLNDLQRIAEEYKIECNAVWDGVKILLAYLGREKTENLMIISEYFGIDASGSHKWTWFDYYNNNPTIPNSRFADNQIIYRLRNWLKSFMPTSFVSADSEVRENYQCTLGNLESDGGGGWIYTITGNVNENSASVNMGTRIFKPYRVQFEICFEWTILQQLIASPKAIDIDGTLYFPIEYETNLEPNTITVECLEFA